MEITTYLRKNCQWWDRFVVVDGALLPVDQARRLSVPAVDIPPPTTSEHGEPVNFEVVVVNK